MEQIIETFGIDTRLIVIQIVNFGLLLAALSYFLYKPVLGMLQKREEAIAQGIADAEAAAIAKSSAEESRKEVVTAAHKEAGDIASRAKSIADERTTEALQVAEKKASDIVAAAERKGSEIKDQAQKDSEAEIAKLAILAAEKVLATKAT